MSRVCVIIVSADSHVGITGVSERYQRIYRNTEIVFNFAGFPKNASFKKLWCNMPIYLEQLRRPSFEAYSNVFYCIAGADPGYF